MKYPKIYKQLTKKLKSVGYSKLTDEERKYMKDIRALGSTSKLKLANLKAPYIIELKVNGVSVYFNSNEDLMDHLKGIA